MSEKIPSPEPESIAETIREAPEKIRNAIAELAAQLTENQK